MHQTCTGAGVVSRGGERSEPSSSLNQLHLELELQPNMLLEVVLLSYDKVLGETL